MLLRRRVLTRRTGLGLAKRGGWGQQPDLRQETNQTSNRRRLPAKANQTSNKRPTRPRIRDQPDLGQETNQPNLSRGGLLLRRRVLIRRTGLGLEKQGIEKNRAREKFSSCRTPHRRFLFVHPSLVPSLQKVTLSVTLCLTKKTRHIGTLCELVSQLVTRV